jgi:hypothetical protein
MMEPLQPLQGNLKTAQKKIPVPNIVGLPNTFPQAKAQQICPARLTHLPLKRRSKYLMGGLVSRDLLPGSQGTENGINLPPLLGLVFLVFGVLSVQTHGEIPQKVAILL